MATYEDPKLRVKVLCAECHTPLETIASKTHENSFFHVEILVKLCEVCLTDTVKERIPTSRAFELVLNDTERVEVTL